MEIRTSSAGSLIRVATIVVLLLPLPGPARADGRDYLCSVENRMDEAMYFERNTDAWTPTPFTVGPGQVMEKWYIDKYSDASEVFEGREYTGRVTSSWTYAGNTMTGVVLWDQKWPESESCASYSAGPGCRLVFENKEVTLVSGTGGRRLLGDLAVKECSGFGGGWLPWGIGCTYPKHDHPYVGTLVS